MSLKYPEIDLFLFAEARSVSERNNDISLFNAETIVSLVLNPLSIFKAYLAPQLILSSFFINRSSLDRVDMNC
jgi:hypothetical protein